jgi:serine phosphatase RsbU (regulator of sigma subunit)
MKVEVGSYSRPFFGEKSIGDSILIVKNNENTLLTLIDGLGHGAKAEKVSQAMKDYLENNWNSDPSDMIRKTHEFMKGSMGAVIGIAIIDHSSRRIKYAGVGNISCKIVGKSNTTLISSDGLVGVRMRSVKNTEITLYDKDLVLMHSDGVSSNVRFEEIPKLKRAFSASLLAKLIVKEVGNEFDDASCIIAKITEENEIG